MQASLESEAGGRIRGGSLISIGRELHRWGGRRWTCLDRRLLRLIESRRIGQERRVSCKLGEASSRGIVSRRLPSWMSMDKMALMVPRWQSGSTQRMRVGVRHDAELNILLFFFSDTIPAHHLATSTTTDTPGCRPEVTTSPSRDPNLFVDRRNQKMHAR